MQILCGIAIMQFLGWWFIAGNGHYGVFFAAGGTMLFAGYAVLLLFRGAIKKECPKCHTLISKKNRICPECGFCFTKGISKEKLTEYIEQEQEKAMTSEQIDFDFEKIETIVLDEMEAFDGDIEEFLQKRSSETEI